MAVETFIPAATQIVHEVKVDFAQRLIQKSIHIVQYDKSLPIIKCNLFLNGYSYTLPSNASVSFRWGKKDHTFVIKQVLGCTPDRKAVYFEVDEQMSYFYGPVNPILELRVGDKTAGSSYIPVEIDRNPVQVTDMESHTEYPDIIGAKEAAEAARDEAIAAAEEIEGIVIDVDEDIDELKTNVSNLQQNKKIIPYVIQGVINVTPYSNWGTQLGKEMYATHIWSVGNTYYASYLRVNKKLDVETNTWVPKTWNGLENIDGGYIWSHNGHTYYSAGSDQYELNTETDTWVPKTWNIESLYGTSIWKLNGHVYYSNSSKQYELNTETDTWVPKAWNAPFELSKTYIWTYDNNAYYMHPTIGHYILNTETDTWVPKTWNGDTTRLSYGHYVFIINDIAYYLDSTTGCYILNKETETWSTIKRTGNAIYADHCVNIYGDIYYGYDAWSNPFTMQKVNAIPEHTEYEETKFYMPYTDTPQDEFDVLTVNSVLNLPTHVNREGDININGTGSVHIVGDTGSILLGKQDATIKTHNLSFKDSNGDERFQFNYDTGIVRFKQVGTFDISGSPKFDIDLGDGDLDFEKAIIRFNSDGSAVITHKFEFDSDNLTSKIDKGNVYIGDSFKVESGTKKTATKDKNTNIVISAQNTNPDNTKDFPGSSITVQASGNIAVVGNMKFNNDTTLSFKDGVAKISNSKHSADLMYMYNLQNNVIEEYETKLLPTNKWLSKWSDISFESGDCIWELNGHYYHNYVFNDVTLEYSPLLDTWTPMTWERFPSTGFSGYNVWKTANHVYASETEDDINTTYELDVASDTWSIKTWDYSPPVIIGRYIWQADSHTYFSWSRYQYEYIDSTDTWIEKVWNGVKPSSGDRIWHLDGHTYYSAGTEQYELNTETDTWVPKTWNGYNPDGYYIRVLDNEHVYYINGDRQYKLDKTTDTWVPNVWTGEETILAASATAVIDGHMYHLWGVNTNYELEMKEQEVVVSSKPIYISADDGLPEEDFNEIMEVFE